MDDQTMVMYEDTPMELKIIDYADNRWPPDAYVWVERRVLKTPPESFSTEKPNFKDVRLVSSTQELNGRF